MHSDALEYAKARKLIQRRGQEIRETANVSRSEVAEEVGADPASIWRWETGERLPRGENARRYAELLRRLDKVAAHDA
jgi:transcriptional regulator with XRE-family HTH domain